MRGQTAPGNKLNIALIGTWGRGLAHFDSIADENVVALCDVWDRNLADAAKRFPNAKIYSDWRKCLEQKDIDAVVICTTDFTHAFVANDGKAGCVTNSAEANALLKREYRAGWTLNG